MSKTIQFFTDNPFFGGGNKYFVDLINSVPKNVETKIVSNAKGFFEGDKKRLASDVEVRSTFIFNNNLISKSFQHWRLAHSLSRIVDLLSPGAFVFNLVQFYFQLKKARPDLVVSSNGGYPAAESTLAMVVASRLLKIPVVLSIVSMPVKRRKILWLYDYALDKIIAKASSQVIVNSKAQISGLCQLRGFPAKKLTCVYNGINDLAVEQKVKIVNNGDRKIVLGYVGRLDKLKGVEYVLRAMAQCRNSQHLKFVIVGEGPENEALIQLASSLRIEDKIKFRGFVNDSITTIHREFDVFVFPSLWEGLPYSILEAMRSGLPVISTNVGGIPEVITHKENGLLVSPANVEELAEALDHIVENKSLIEQYSKKTRGRFEKEFTSQAMQEKFQHLISQYLNNKN